MFTKARYLAFATLLIAPTASATEGQLIFDTLACKDRNIILGLSQVMRNTDGLGFNEYVHNLKASGQCAKVERGKVVTFRKTDDGACLSLKPGEPCYWTPNTPRSRPETTGQSYPRQ